MLRYALYENLMTDADDDFFASVVDAPVATEEDIIEEMVREGSSVSTSEALAVMEEYLKAAQRLGKRGFRLSTRIFEIDPSISGVFKEDQAFNRDVHTLNANMRPGSGLEGLYDECPVQRVEANRPTPTIRFYDDAGSDTTNTQVTVGRGAVIRGYRLKYDENAADEGIYFVAVADSTREYKVQFIMDNRASKLIFGNPDSMTPGKYWLEVRARVYGPEKGEVRIGRLPEKLTVPGA